MAYIGHEWGFVNFDQVYDWVVNNYEMLGDFAEAEGLKLGAVAQPLRAAMTGRSVSPSVFNVMETLGREESLARLNDAIGSSGA